MVLYQLKSDDVRNYRSVFNSWTTSGCMNVDDLCALLQRLLRKSHVPPHHDIRLLACDMINAIDVDGKTISFQAFVDYMATKHDMRDVNYEYAEAFKLFDTKGTGKLGVDDMKQIIVKLNADVTDKTVQEMVNAADIDGDGNVDYEEFVKLVEK